MHLVSNACSPVNESVCDLRGAKEPAQMVPGVRQSPSEESLCEACTHLGVIRLAHALACTQLPDLVVGVDGVQRVEHLLPLEQALHGGQSVAVAVAIAVAIAVGRWAHASHQSTQQVGELQEHHAARFWLPQRSQPCAWP